MKTVIAYFTDRLDSENAFRELEKQEYNPETLSIMQKKKDDILITSGEAGHIIHAATTSLLVGVFLGGILGALVWYGTLPIPGFQNVLIGRYISGGWGLPGVWSQIVSAGITLGIVMGVFGGLIGLSIPREKSHIVEEKIKDEGTILALASQSAGKISEIKNILEKHNASQIRTLSMSEIEEEVEKPIVLHNGQRDPEKIHVVDIGN